MINFMLRILELIQNFLKKPDYSNSGRVYLACLSKLGKDASPKDLVDDDVGCAETVSTILHELWADIPVISGTYTLWDYLKFSGKFKEILIPQSGDIVISPTGTGNGRIKNGHVGFVGEGEVIISNDSSTGLLLENYTRSAWKAKFVTLGGFPMRYYRKT